MAGESAAEQARRMREKAERLQRAADNWERGAEGERRVGAVLDQLSPEYVVYHDLRLPDSKANVDHLVVGPGGVWAVDTKNYSYPVNHGTGKGAGKLWAGKRPLDERVRTAQWEASVVADLIGHPVEPMLCIIAPSLPSPSFDHGGVRICGPARVSAELARIIDPTDVDAAAAAVQHAFGVAPAARPEQASRTHLAPPPAERHARPAGRRSPPQQAPVRRARFTRQQRPSRTRGASRPKRTSAKRADGSMGEILKLLAALAGLWLAVIVIQTDGFTNAISAVFSGAATRSTDRVRERAEEAAASRSTTSVSRSSTTSTSVLIADPPAVAYTVACAPDGDSWDVTWAWPGSPPAGVAGYGILTQHGDRPAIDHTTDVWRSPGSGRPAALQVTADTTEMVIGTQYRAADGTVLAETEEPFRVPSLHC